MYSTLSTTYIQVHSTYPSEDYLPRGTHDGLPGPCRQSRAQTLSPRNTSFSPSLPSLPSLPSPCTCRHLSAVWSPPLPMSGSMMGTSLDRAMVRGNMSPMVRAKTQGVKTGAELQKTSSTSSAELKFFSFSAKFVQFSAICFICECVN